MALSDSWLSRGDSATMFGQADWDWLRGQNTPETTAWQVMSQLRANQNVLHEWNRPGFSGRAIGGTHGLFDEIQGQAQSEHPTWNKIQGVDQWRYNDWGGVGFGRDDIAAARERGASEYQIRQLYERAAREGVKTSGPHAQDFIATAPVSPWDYGAHGGWGFGMADVDAMGDNLKQLKGARDFARQNKLNIGAGVIEHITQLAAKEDADARAQRHLDHLSGLDEAQAVRDAEAASLTATFRADTLSQQQAAAAEQQRLQEEMAAQVARVRGSSPTGVGSPASIKGSRLSITQSGGRKGTKRFARPTQYMNTLGMTSGGSTSTGKSPLNL